MTHDTFRVALQVSCPHCGTVNIVELTYDELGPVSQLLIEILGPDSKGYKFDGSSHCKECGKKIEVMLTVNNIGE